MLGKIIYYGITALLNRIFAALPLKENRVLFISDVRSDMGGNFKFVCDEISDGYEIKTSFKADRRIRRSLGEYLRQCLYLATSKYVFLEDYAECTAFMHVRKGQELIQLWHGSGAYKRFGHSRDGKDDVGRIHPGYKRYTKAFVSSEFVRPVFAGAFSISKDKVLATGVPRTDAFFNEAYKAKKTADFYKEYPEAEDKKIILFAPTYRGKRVEDASYGFDQIDLQKLYEELSAEYLFVIKWHPALYNNIKDGKVKSWDLKPFEGFAYDLSDKREVNDLLFVADILITDYSSIIFDHALLKKPIIYFIYDLEEYEEGRGLYFPFEDYVYGDTARTQEELTAAIRAENFYEDKWKIFTEKFTKANDGKAARRIIKAVFPDDHTT